MLAESSLHLLSKCEDIFAFLLFFILHDALSPFIGLLLLMFIILFIKRITSHKSVRGTSPLKKSFSGTVANGSSSLALLRESADVSLALREKLRNGVFPEG